jgi:hypothetical protein
MTDSTTTYAAGWYPDSNVPGTERYYDGVAWTAQTRPLATERAASPAAPEVATPNNNIPTYAAGWYSDTNVPGTERYFDGTAWTDQTRPLAFAAGSTPTVAETPVKRPWYKRKPIIIPVAIVGGIIVLSGIINAVNGGGSEQVADEKPITQVEEEPVAEEEPEPVYVDVPNLVGITGTEAVAALAALGLEADYDGDLSMPVTAQNLNPGSQVEDGSRLTLTLQEKPKLTVAQESALSSAQAYMRSLGGFSRQGLIDQLMYEQFSVEDATWAVDNGGFDWMQAAADSAASYMDSIGGFSRGSLIDQLLYEGFTQAEAEHGASSVGL